MLNSLYSDISGVVGIAEPLGKPFSKSSICHPREGFWKPIQLPRISLCLSIACIVQLAAREALDIINDISNLLVGRPLRPTQRPIPGNSVPDQHSVPDQYFVPGSH
jgi:hypothetical protein